MQTETNPKPEASAAAKLKAKYRPLLTGAEILTIVAKFQAIPMQERTALEAAVLVKLATFAYKLQTDAVTPTYIASEETNKAYLAVAAEAASKVKLGASELKIGASAKRSFDSTKAEWAYCWERFTGAYMLTPSELVSALEHCYLEFTLPSDFVARLEGLLDASATAASLVDTTFILEATKLLSEIRRLIAYAAGTPAEETAEASVRCTNASIEELDL